MVTAITVSDIIRWTEGCLCTREIGIGIGDGCATLGKGVWLVVRFVCVVCGSEIKPGGGTMTDLSS